MDTQATLGSLNLFTLVAVLAIVVGGFLWFLRKRSNREGLNGKGLQTDLDAVATKNADETRARDTR